MAERKALTKTVSKRCRRASRIEKTTMLDELCALIGWIRAPAPRSRERARPAPRAKC